MDSFDTEPFTTEDRDGVHVIRARLPKLAAMEAEALLDLVFPPDGTEHALLVIDLTGVEYVNSGLMSVLWRASQARALRLAGVQGEVEELLNTMGFLHLLDCDRTVADAIAALTGGGPPG